jgi:hypothetical protein
VTHGQTLLSSGKNRAQQTYDTVQDFWKLPNKILIASYLTTSAAISLHNACRAIFFDRPWDWGRYAQALKRIHMENDHEIEINPIVFGGTLEVDQEKRLIERESYNNALWQKEEMTLEDLQTVLQGR